MKKYIPILFLITLLLCGCCQIPESYSFPNQLEPIVSIELLHNMNPGGTGYDESNMVLLYSMNETESQAFMDKLCDLPTMRVGSPVPGGYGRYVTKITYENGDVEMYGPSNMEYIPAGTQGNGIGEYQFASKGKDYLALFAEYFDLEELPEPPPLE